MVVVQCEAVVVDSALSDCLKTVNFKTSGVKEERRNDLDKCQVNDIDRFGFHVAQIQLN